MRMHAPGLVALLTLTACNTFRPVAPEDRPPFEARALELASENAEVRLAVLGADESRAVYGTAMESRDLQPVWIEVTNLGDLPLWLLPSSLDATYYSPLEAAWLCQGWLNDDTRKRLQMHFEALVFENPVRPGETREGFVLTHVDRRVKWVELDLWSQDGLESVRGSTDIPGTEADFDRVDFETLHPRSEWEHLETPDDLRRVAASFPPCTTNAAGTREGDPLNFVVVLPRDGSLAAFVRRGWHPTEPMGVGSSLRTAGSFVFGSHYRYSPVSPLHAFGRPQDLAAQKARNTIHQRNHLRLWQTPYTYGDGVVCLGQISRDIGVRGTTRTWSLTTHAIDPDVDETRAGLLEDLLYSGHLRAFGFTRGVPVSTRTDPRENLTGDVWYSDGLRLVMVLGADEVELDTIELFPWERFDPAAAGGGAGTQPAPGAPEDPGR